MDNLDIDTNLDFMRAQWMLNRFDTVDQFVHLWVMIGPYPLSCPALERVTPWWAGMEYILE